MMIKKMVLATAACLLLVGSLAFFTENALAADAAKPADKASSADHKIATQDGLATKEFDKDKLPGKMEIGLTIGSIVAVIAAVKYL
jgi:hypothetical protein